MEKRIGGKRFNTETARKVGQWDNNASDKPKAYCMVETLYKKKTGEYFLHYLVGALLPVGREEDTLIEAISPMTEEAARAWAEQKLDSDDVARIFGIDGSDQFEPIYAAIPTSLKKEMDHVRKETGETTKEFLSRAIKIAIDLFKESVK